MSTGTNNKARVSILPFEFDLPDQQDSTLFSQVMNERERDTATVVNQKENALYALEENVNGQTWYFNPTPGASGFRRLYIVPALMNGVPVVIPHELGDVSGFTFTDYKGWVQDFAGTQFRPIPADFIVVTATDIEITGDATYAGLEGFIALDYIKT